MRAIPASLTAVIIAGAVVGISALRQSQDDAAVGAAVQQQVAQQARPHVKAVVWSDVRRFYQLRSGAAAWTQRGGQIDRALDVLRHAPDHGLAAVDYDEPSLTARVTALKQGGADRSAAAANLDVDVTAALLALGRDVALGRTAPDRLDGRWKARRMAPDFASTLNDAAVGHVEKWLDAIKPSHPQYASLQKALLDLYAIQKKGGWPRVAAPALKPGAGGEPVAALRARLLASGDLKSEGAADAAGTYGADLESAVRSFQAHHDLKETGIADAATMAAINVPIGARIQQLDVNLERWRWMPDDFGPRYVLVDIPAYHLDVLEDGKPVLSMKVIVGRADDQHRTPVFSAPMTSVIFSPYWNIPDTIADGEIAPALAKDSAYLAKHGIEVIRTGKGGGATVDPSSINWDDPGALKDISFRQRPGAENALGHVKFSIADPFDIYLHDTPSDNLFERPGRALSHGCVRLEEPDALAKYVLRDQPEWDEARMDAAMKGGVETPVKMKSALPVHVVYFTAWVDAQGGLRLHPDVYRYDAVQSHP